MPEEKYPLPAFLNGRVDPTDYRKWLHRKAVAHVQRDRGRGNKTATNEEYKKAIHAAIITSDGLDAYTRRPLNWEQIGEYDNDMSAELGRIYRLQFRFLPTVDHVDDGLGAANFKICGLQTNDSKSCLTHNEFVSFCTEIVEEAKRDNQPPLPTPMSATAPAVQEPRQL